MTPFRVRITDTMNDSWQLMDAGAADVVIAAYPDESFVGDQQYTHVFCATEEAAQAVEALIPIAQRNPQDSGQSYVVIYVDAPSGYVIEALAPLFKQQHVDEDMITRLALEQLASIGVPVEGLVPIGMIVIHQPRGMMSSWPATDSRLAELGPDDTAGLDPEFLALMGLVDEMLKGGFEAVLNNTATYHASRPHSAAHPNVKGLLGEFLDEIGEIDPMIAGIVNGLYPDTTDYMAIQPLHHPDQVRSARKLKVGREYILVTTDGREETRVRFTGIKTTRDGRWMRYDYLEGDHYFSSSESYLADIGLEPYTDGNVTYWHDSNYVRRAPRRPKFVYRVENGTIVRRRNV